MNEIERDLGKKIASNVLEKLTRGIDLLSMVEQDHRRAAVLTIEAGIIALLAFTASRMKSKDLDQSMALAIALVSELMLAPYGVEEGRSPRDGKIYSEVLAEMRRREAGRR